MSSRTDFFDKVATLKREGASFAVATVVARRAPVSAHLGDRAIVYADGRMEGFVGGACSREIIRKQGLESLRARRARLVSISPDATTDASDPDRVMVAMTCASEGAVDVYVEPVVPPRRLVVVGTTPVAEAVARLARAMEYDVTRVVDSSEQRDVEMQVADTGMTVATLESLQSAIAAAPDVAAVVASQGHYDEQALEEILKSGTAGYVGLVASRKRGTTVREYLLENGVPRIDDVRVPAGIDLGARTPAEVALSILAEIVERYPSNAVQPASDIASVESTVAITAIDPVCGMEVAIATAKHQAELDGTMYYFCCPHCRSHFLRDPQGYLAARP